MDYEITEFVKDGILMWKTEYGIEARYFVEGRGKDREITIEARSIEYEFIDADKAGWETYTKHEIEFLQYVYACAVQNEIKCEKENT